MEGWIKLYRQFEKWEWFSKSEMVHLFIYILINANHENKKWKGIEIKRGQFVTGLNSMSEATGISFQTLRTCLKKLEKTQEINRQTNNQNSIITVLNYDNYQCSEEISTSKLTNDQQATNKQLTTTKNEKNNKNENNIEKADFLSKIITAFQSSYFEVFQQEYSILGVGKERAAASKILETYKKKYPAATSEETITGLQAYFRSCCQVPDDWLQKNMSLPIIVSKFNEINNSIKNGKSKIRSVASRGAEINAIIDAVYDAKGMQ